MAEFVKVAQLNEVAPGEMKIVELGGEEIALANVDGQIFAFHNTCPHSGGPLGEGELNYDVVTCPWHGSEFNVRTGEVLGPPAHQAIPTYQVQVEGEDIKVAKP